MTRAWLTPIMNLLNLAPDLQEQLLFLPLTVAGRDPLKEWQVRPIVAQISWIFSGVLPRGLILVPEHPKLHAA